VNSKQGKGNKTSSVLKIAANPLRLDQDAHGTTTLSSA
jgi:hypothetical protein